MSYLVIIALFIAFVVGLNLGLHGAISILHPNTALIEKNLEKETTLNESPTIKVSQPTNFPPSITSRPQTPIVSQFPLITKDSETKKPAETIHPKENSGYDNIEKLYKIEKAIQAKFSAKETDLNFSGDYSNIPIILLTCNRPQLLDETLTSLLKVKNVKKENVLIVQDGRMDQIADIAHKYQIQLLQNTGGVHLRNGAANDGASRIAFHYKFALTSGFDKYPKASGIVIIEDDLLFANDFYDYLVGTAPILERDPSIFAISSWNDNGFRNLAKNPLALRRTEFFPGLGWYLDRKLYKGELEAKWPESHWDHWLRSPETHKGREIVYPQVPRTFHNGIKGTFMNLETHNRYFKDIVLNKETGIDWTDDKHHLVVTSEAYENRIHMLIKSCRHLKSVEELTSLQDEIVCIWIDSSIVSDGNPAFGKYAKFFGIWHEHQRGTHHGLHEFYFYSNYIVLLNINNQINHSYKHLMPLGVKIIDKNQFDLSHFSVSSIKLTPKEKENHIIPSKERNKSCDEVCRNLGKSCNENKFEEINYCDLLKENFGCSQCLGSLGSEQPAFVSPDAPTAHLPGFCLYNSDTRSAPIDCESKHEWTQRLCYCD